MKAPKSDRDLIANNIDKLGISNRVREILSYRFGGLTPKHTLEETGKKFGITRQRVQQIEKQVLEKIENLK